MALAARWLPVVNHPLLILAAGSPYLSVGAALASVLLLASNQRWWAAAGALVLMAAAVLVQAPRLIPDGHGEGVAVRVVTVNLRLGQADPTSIVALARSRADVLIVQELTPDSVDSLTGLAAEFPYRVIDPDPSATGVGIWSRYRLNQSIKISGYELGMLSATVEVPGVAAEPLILAAHLMGPWPQPIDVWRREIASMSRTLDDVARWAGDACVIVGGDFNATADMRPFRQLLESGYHDAAAQAGAGLKPTYPATGWLPPLIGIDHILTRNCSATDMGTVRVDGTDHLAVFATIQLPT